MNLIYFTEEAYAYLKKSAKDNQDKYLSRTPWIEDYFASIGLNRYFKTSSIVVPDINLQCTGHGEEAEIRDDLNNAKLLYEAFKITPAQAADPKMWSALCLITFRSYVTNRWQNATSVHKRFIATNARPSLCFFNALSRLWWFAHLTYDEEEKSNPFHLTEVLFSARQIQTPLMASRMSMNKNIVKGILKALRRILGEKKEAGQVIDVFRRLCLTYLNHLGAYVDLDSLTAENIENKAYKFMRKKIG